MIRWFSTLDDHLANGRELWTWIGQVAVVVLGIHLAADQLDDTLVLLLGQIPYTWDDAEFPVVLSAWAAVAVELSVAVWAAGALMRGIVVQAESFAEWKKHLSVEALVRPVFWLPVALAGSWSLAMATEDIVAPWLGDAAIYVGAAAGFVVAWRLGLTGLVRVTRAPPLRERFWSGWWWVPVPLGVAFLAARTGIPLWGWLS